MNFFKSNDNQTAPDLSLPPLSLLSSQALPHPRPISTLWEEDLGLDELVNALALDRRHRGFVRGVLATLETDENTIRWRQDVLSDFLQHPELTDEIETLLPAIASLGQDTAMLGRRTRSLLMETSDRLSELDLYTELVEQLHTALAGKTIQSAALNNLRDELQHVLEQPAYSRLRDELPALRQPLQNIGSITVAINLDLNLKPISTVLLGIHGREVGEPTPLLARLFQMDDTRDKDLNGIAPVHRFPQESTQRRYSELFQDVDQLMKQTAKPVAQSLKWYVKTSSRTLVTLESELALFVAAAKMIRELRVKGIPFTQPDVLAAAQRETKIESLHNLQLLLREEATIASDVLFDDSGRVGVLTGPNSGGKTTYLRSVGLAQVMFQAGLFVPAEAAQISPVQTLLTHFPRLETRQQGRLAEEAERLRYLFGEMSENSLVLLNETFSSTAFGEALYLAQDILSALCAMGARAVFATHLVELIDQFDQIESATPVSSRLCSLVAGIDLSADGDPQPTYQVTRGKPLGRSFAREIARKYGISLDQILQNRSQQELK